MEEQRLITLENISKAYDGGTVISNINLYIRKKEFVTLLGPSGCGKTTTLRIIGGFLTPTDGNVLFDGQRINDQPPYTRQINTVFQRYALFPHLNVYENIAFPLRLKKVAEEEIQSRVADMLKMAENEDIDSTTFAQLKAFEPMLKPDFRAAIERNIDEVKTLLGSEIVLRYYYQKGQAAYQLRFDKELKRALQELK